MCLESKPQETNSDVPKPFHSRLLYLLELIHIIWWCPARQGRGLQDFNKFVHLLFSGSWPFYGHGVRNSVFHAFPEAGWWQLANGQITRSIDLMVPEIFKLILSNKGRSTKGALQRDLLVDMDSKTALLDNYLADREVTLVYFLYQ